MKEMKTLTINGETFEIVDEAARSLCAKTKEAVAVLSFINDPMKPVLDSIELNKTFFIKDGALAVGSNIATRAIVPITYNYNSEELILTPTSGYKIAVYFLDENLICIGETGWVENGSASIPAHSYFAMHLAFVDNSEITSDNFSNPFTVEKNGLSKRVDVLEERITIKEEPELHCVSYYAEYKTTFTIDDTVACNAEDNYFMAIVVNKDGTQVYDSGWKASPEYIADSECEVIVRGRRSDYANVSVSDLANFNIAITRSVASVVNGMNEKLDESESAIRLSPFYNPFAGVPIYHHLNQETAEKAERCDIPAQSLYDINYAKSLGFNMIEVNPQKCSDGVFVCKHGVSGALGYGLKAADGEDYSTTAFTSVSSDWLRSNISYDTIDKYSGHIPTLEEVCAECKKLSMMIKVSGMEAIEVARKYLPDDMIWATLWNADRGDFRGIIEKVWDNTSTTIDDCIAVCLTIGKPLNIVIAAGTTPTDDEVKELVQKAHKNGFTVGMVYPTSADIVKALSLGVDVLGSTMHNINLFDVGDVLNIRHLSDPNIELSTGAEYDSVNDIITMANGSTINVPADNMISGKLSLRIRYSGSVTINGDLTYDSDGTVTIPYAIVWQRKTGKTYGNWLTIKANSQATIYEISLSCATI